jgi:uncharacterized iron-regulated membrane protein
MSVKRGRALYLAIHKYVGLGLGLWIAMVGLTGSILVYQRELEALQHADLYCPSPAGPRLGLDAVLATVRAAFPDLQVAGIERDLVSPNESWKVFLQAPAHTSSQTVIVRGRDVTAFVDPTRGTVLGTIQGRTWLDTVRDLHVELLAAQAGRIATGVLGIALLLSIAAGVMLWWPSARRLRQAFTLRWTSNTRLPRKMWDLHHIAGIYSLIVLLVVTATGVVLIFQSGIQSMVGHVVDISPTRVDPQAMPDLGPVDMAGAVAVVERLYPGATVRRVAPPTRQRPTYLFQIVPSGRSNMFTTNVQVRAESGRVPYIFDPANQAPARSFIGLWSVFIHNGAAAGFVGRWLVLLSGLAFAGLLGSGVYIWAKKI